MSRRPTTNQDALRVLRVSQTITCQTAIDARGVCPVLRWSQRSVDSKTPHLAFSAGGACRTAPESGDDGRTLVSTPSIASSCTDHPSRQPVPRCPPRPELHFEQPSNGGVRISRVAESNRAPRSTDSNRRFAHVAPERAYARAPADGALARASLPFAVGSKGPEFRHERVLCSGRVIDGSPTHAERTAVEHSGKTKSRRR